LQAQRYGVNEEINVKIDLKLLQNYFFLVSFVV